MTVRAVVHPVAPAEVDAPSREEQRSLIKGKRNRALTKIGSLKQAAEREIKKFQKAAETRATHLVDVWKVGLAKLVSCRPQIDAVQKDFAKARGKGLRGKVTILGCTSFDQFCDKKLGRTRQAVYYMLSGKQPKGKGKSKKVGTRRPATPPTLPKMRSMVNRFLGQFDEEMQVGYIEQLIEHLRTKKQEATKAAKALKAAA